MKKQMLTSATITKKNMMLLDKISKESKYSGGKKLSRSAVLRSFIVTAMKINIDIHSIKNEKELESCFKSAFKNFDTFQNNYLKDKIQLKGKEA